MDRLPSEIWEEILDCVIDIPFFFDLGCTLDDFYYWTTKQIEVSVGAEDLYSRSERQRRTLRQVCHSWKAFAESRAGRWASGGQITARSLHVSIEDTTEEHYNQETKWEMVALDCSLHPTTGKYGAPILGLAENHEKHTKIQRIHLQLYWPYSDHSQYSQYSHPLLKCLAAFSNLRTLRLDIDITTAPPHPIVLLRLTCLRWVSGAVGRRPHECLILPSLIRLGVSIEGYNDDTAALVAPYQTTLKHLILGYEDPIEMVDNGWTLPPWENYPHLVELAIDTTRTPPSSVPCSPPPRHPLRRFRIPTWDSRIIQMLLGQEAQRNRLECIVVTRLRWHEGVVLPSGHVGVVGDNHLQDDAMSVIQLCSERGVRLEDGLHKTVKESNPVTLRWHRSCVSPKLPESCHITETRTDNPPKEDSST